MNRSGRWTRYPLAMGSRTKGSRTRRSRALPALLVLGSLGVGCAGSPGGSGGEIADGQPADGDGPGRAPQVVRLAPGVPEGPAGSFLLLTLDTTRPDHLSTYGAAEAETPHLQGLGEAGAVFENAYATTPVTLPSHASILTGLDPDGHGVRNNGIHFLPEDLPTLATVLHGEGLATAAFVSAAVLEARYGLDRGFDIYDDDLSAGKPKELRMIAERTAEVTVDAALRWLDGPTGDGEQDGEAGAERFFLWVHLFDPHAAYEPPAPWADRFADRPYDGEIAYMDAQIGRLLAHPRIADPTTLVMAVADHGESLGEHGEASHAMLAYDSTLRVPWLVRGPGVVAGARITAPASQIDLFPTALGLLGLGAAQEGKEPTERAGRTELPGRDLGTALQGNPGSPGVRDLYAETFVPFYTYGWAKLRTLRREGWKYIDAPTPELYHVTADPGELENLHEREPRRAEELSARLAERRARTQGGDDEGSSTSTVQHLDRETRDKLRSLGYLSGSGAVRADVPNDQRPDPKEMIDLHRTMDRAEHHLYARDFEQAVAELRRVLGRDRSNRAALVDLAKALGELGRWEEAVEAAARALALHGDDPDLYLTLAGLEAARGRPEAALAALDTALALDPRALDAKVEKARLLLQEPGVDRRAAARELLDEVLTEDPDHGRAQVIRAEEILAAGEAGDEGRGELQAAETRLERVTEREPFLAEGWRALGRVRERAGDTEGAERAYRQGLEYQERDPGLLTLLGLLRVETGSAEARDLLERAREAAPAPRAEIHDGLAALAVARGDWTVAETEARKALEVDPDRASAWNHLAVALEEQARGARALDAYDRALDADPGYWQAAFNRGLLLRKEGREDEAMASFRRVLSRVPDHAASHYELGVLHGARGDAVRAREHLEAALAAAPDHLRAEQIRRLLAALR